MTKIEALVEILKKRIDQGYYITNSQLPSEREIAEEFNLSRNTVHVALLKLKDEGLIVIKPRSGTYIKNQKELSDMENTEFKVLMAAIKSIGERLDVIEGKIGIENDRIEVLKLRTEEDSKYLEVNNATRHIEVKKYLDEIKALLSMLDLPKEDRSCDNCINKGTMDCPNSYDCEATVERKNFKRKPKIRGL